jgi:transcriptional regulator NrdR family protein
MLDIVEADTVDAVSDKPDTEKKESVKSNKPASPEKREEAKKELINEGGEATEVQVKSIKNGLKKLREKSDAYEPYIKEIVGKIKNGLKKSEAEDILIEIGNKVAE